MTRPLVTADGCPPAGPVEVVVTDLSAVGTFKGPDMCPADCGDGPIYCEAIKCVEGQDPVSIGVFVDGVLTLGASVPEGYQLCSRCPDQIEVTSKAPSWETICVDGCVEGLVCLTTADDGSVVFGPWIVDGVAVAAAPDWWKLGVCPVLRPVCVTLWKADAEESLECFAGKLWAWLDGKGSIVHFTPGPADNLGKITKAEMDAEIGGPYAVQSCDDPPPGLPPTTQMVPVPLDIPEVTDGVLEGSATIVDACSVTVCPLPPEDCDGELVYPVVTYTDLAGTVHTVTVTDFEETFCANGEPVIVTGPAAVSATTLVEQDIEIIEGEC